jgi:AraC family transcriptional regulator
MSMSASKALHNWSHFDPPPKIILNSAQGGWSGAEFQEIVSPRFGSFDASGSGNGKQDIVVSWTLGPLRVRYGANRSFQEVFRRPVVHMPGDELRGEWEGVETGLTLHLSERFIQAALEYSGHLVRSRLADQQLTKIEHLMQLVRADVRAGSPAGPIAAEALLAALLNIVFPDDEHVRTMQQERGSRVIERVREYIEGNLGEPLSLLQIAALADMSVRHMSRAFKATTGYAPHEHIVRRRIMKASELIRSGHLGLADIAIAVGFSSHAHMTTAFQRIRGQPPSLFRNHLISLPP